jgi:hypothetical protein
MKSPKNAAKLLAFFTQITAIFAEKIIIAIVFLYKKPQNISPKIAKIVIIIITPD